MAAYSARDGEGLTDMKKRVVFLDRVVQNRVAETRRPITTAAPLTSAAPVATTPPML
jgi:hypothetical protein